MTHIDTCKDTKATLKCCYALHKLLAKHIHPPEMEINPPKTVCGCPRSGVMKTKTKTNKQTNKKHNNNKQQPMTHSILSLYGKHLSMYNCIIITPRAFNWRTLQLASESQGNDNGRGMTMTGEWRSQGNDNDRGMTLTGE